MLSNDLENLAKMIGNLKKDTGLAPLHTDTVIGHLQVFANRARMLEAATINTDAKHDIPKRSNVVPIGQLPDHRTGGGDAA